MRVQRSWVWRHKTKVIASGFAGGSYVQANLAQVGRGLPPHVFAYAAVGASGIVFVLGFLNQILPLDDAP
jgi:hypothetical protein